MKYICLRMHFGNYVNAVFIFFMVGLLFNGNLRAAEQGLPSIDPAENFESASRQLPTDNVLEELFQFLDQESELATKTKLNIDFVPGMMTILRGQDLTARGIQNVYEALALVPGIELTRTNDGQPQILVRGAGKTFFSSKVKFLLNNISFNAALGAATNLLILPIEQVDRIEVIRGPGSAIYGEYASIGVVNIITRKHQDSFFLRRSDIDKFSYGLAYTHKVPDTELVFNISLSGMEAKGGNIDASQDVLYGTPLEPLSNAPGPINNREDHSTVVFDALYKQYTFALQRVEQGLGDFHGLANALPSDDQHVIRKIITESVELARHWQVSDNWNAELTLGLLDFELSSGEYELFPPGFSLPPGDPTQYPDGVLGSPNYQDKKYYLRSEFNFSGLSQHEWLLGAEISWLDQGKTYVDRNYNPQTLQPNGGAPAQMERFTGDQNWMREGLDRQVMSLYLQDQYAYSENLKFIAGLRFDDYDDVGSDVTPRIATVYQLADKQTLKFQYSRSYRPPTFLELYIQNNLVVEGNPDLDSENLDAIEIGYVFNNGVTIFRSTLFYYSLRDLIVVDSANSRYVNQGKINSTGFEFELQHQLTRKVKVDTTLTVLDAQDENTNEDVAGIADLTANFAMLFEPWPDYVFGVQFKAIGDRKREPADSRFKLDGYNTLDITANAFNLGVKGLSLRTGIKNLFDSDVVYPSPLVSFPAGSPLRPAYQDDYPQLGREVFVQMEIQFN